MTVLSPVIKSVLKKRIHKMETFMKYPIEVQKELFEGLITAARQTEWGLKYDYKSIHSYQDFKERVPISTYEEMFPYIERIMKGEQNVLWPTKVTWFSKSSGTTNAKSKFIPVTAESLKESHYKAGKDMLSIYVNNYNYQKLFKGRTISLGGSHQPNHLNPDNSHYGDVSAVIMENLPKWAQIIRAPKLETALIDKWENKIDKIIAECSDQKIYGFAGVPTWTVVLIQEMVKRNKVDSILDLWPELELFAHGAVSFEPYREMFKELIPSDKMNYLEIYNASEGSFGLQDIPGSGEMLLMLNHGAFYEFMPMEEYGKEHPKTVLLDEVVPDKNYAMIISTNAGLWRYLIGDTIRFTSVYPFRIRITGRTKHFINAFGEEVVVENADEAIKRACLATEASIDNYTAAPIYFEEGGDGGHEWLIEFKQDPNDFEKFVTVLDKSLQEINSDYEAKRQNDIALKQPIVHKMKSGTFYNWLAAKGKLGGQFKVPRLSNSREYIDEILKFND